MTNSNYLHYKKLIHFYLVPSFYRVSRFHTFVLLVKCASFFILLTLAETILLGASQVRAENSELQKTKPDGLLAEKIKYPNTSNIRALIEAFEVMWIPSGAMEPTLHGTPNT